MFCSQPKTWARCHVLTQVLGHVLCCVCMGDEVVGYGGRDRSNASSSASMELGITRVALAMSSALRSMDTASHRRYTKATARVSHNMAWQRGAAAERLASGLRRAQGLLGATM